MEFVLMTLTHPLAPAAWWAVNTPQVTEMLQDSLGVQSPGGRMLKDDDDNRMGLSDDTMRMIMIIGFVVSMAIPLVAWIITGMMYKSKVTDQRPPLPNPVPPEHSLASRDFKYPLCACFDNCQYCLHGMCLESVRTADTYQTVGAATYWTVLLVFLGAWLFAQTLAFGLQMLFFEISKDSTAARSQRMQMNNAGNLCWFVASLFLAMYLAGLRKKLRARLGDPMPDGKCCQDFVLWWWCNCCVAIQDARQVDEANGVIVECCCKLIPQAQPPKPVIGNEVVVGNVVG